MSETISAEEQPLLEIFGSHFFVVPPYQRPYAWEQEHTEALFDDLFDFYKSE